MPADAEPLSFAHDRPSPRFLVREVVIEASGSRPYDRGAWADALVVVEAGVLEVECLRGLRVSFRQGAVLHLDALPARTLRNPGAGPLRLSAVSRRA